MKSSKKLFLSGLSAVTVKSKLISCRKIRPNWPKIITLQSTLVNLVAVFILFVSIFAWKTDRRLRCRVVPSNLRLLSHQAATVKVVQVATINVEPSNELRGTAVVPTSQRSESKRKNTMESVPSYQVQRQADDPYTFYKMEDTRNRPKPAARPAWQMRQMLSSHVDILDSVKNTLNINGISILHLVEFLPYNMLQFIISIFRLDCQNFYVLMYIFRSIKLISVPLYLYFIYRMFRKT